MGSQQSERLFEYQRQRGFSGDSAGIQRSSYFVSMPLRYGVPIMIVSAIEHWLYSQAVFIIRGIRINLDGSEDANWTTTGFSFIPSIIGKAMSSASSVELCPDQFFLLPPPLLLSISSHHGPRVRYVATAR